MPQKILVAYRTHYGSTRQYAEWICQALQCDIIDLGKAKEPNYQGYDIIIFGGYLIVGRNTVATYINRSWPGLKDKQIFIFATGGGAVSDTSLAEKAFENSFPAEIRAQVEHYTFPGRMVHKKLNLLDKLLMFGGALMAKDPEVKKELKSDFDRMKPDYILPLINDVKSLI